MAKVEAAHTILQSTPHWKLVLKEKLIIFFLYKRLQQKLFGHNLPVHSHSAQTHAKNPAFAMAGILTRVVNTTVLFTFFLLQTKTKSFTKETLRLMNT